MSSERCAALPGLHVYLDAPVAASSVKGTLPETYYPSEVAAKDLQVGGVTGAGVTVAVVDSGLWSQHGPLQTPRPAAAAASWRSTT